MAYQSGTITSDPAPSTTMLNVIETMLGAHAAWAFVEERVSGIYTCRIWRNKGTVNALGQDWYLIIRRTTTSLGTSQILLNAAETYDGAGNVSRSCPGSATLTPDATYNAVAAAPVALSALSASVTPISTLTSTFTYWLIVTNNTIVLRNTAAAFGFYVGLYSSFWLTDWPTKDFPLVDTLIAVSSAAGSVTRLPGTTVATSSAGAVDLSQTAAAWDPALGTIGGTVPDLGNAVPRGSRLAVSGASTGVVVKRGLYYDLLYFQVATGVAAGDTIVVNGQTYVCMVVTGTVGYFANTAAA